MLRTSELHVPLAGGALGGGRLPVSVGGGGMFGSGGVEPSAAWGAPLHAEADNANKRSEPKANRRPVVIRGA